MRKIKFLIILWIWLITGCSLPVNRIENNYYLTILESGIELNTNGEIIKKWNWNGKEYYVQHVKIIQIKIDKIHGDAIGGKEVEGERSIATLTQSVGIPIYDKDLRISADDLKIGDIVELKYIDTSIEQGALSPFRGYEGILLVKEIVKVKIKDGEIYKFKRFETKDIKVIKDVTREKKAEEEKEFQKELKELENLERKDSKLKEN